MRRSDLARIGLVGAAVMGGTLAYAVGIEPYWIETTHVEIQAPRLPEAFDGYTLWQISDLHMRQMGRRERAVARLLAGLATPDLVVVTGDMVHTSAGIPAFLRLAGSFRARDGIHVVFGNSEQKNGVRPHAFEEALRAHGMTPLLNRHVLIDREGARIAVAGVDDPVHDRDRLPTALAGIPEDLFTLLLMHSPDGIAEAALSGVDLVLSGHTHGGQVHLPFIGAIYTRALLGLRMRNGHYAGMRLRHAIGIRPGRTQLYVTRGIGVSGLALRFLCRPELTVITLRRGVPGLRRVGGAA